MSESYEIAALKRERAGKGAARAERRAGRVPAVIYGDKKDPMMISIEERLLVKELHKQGFFTNIYAVTVDGKANKVLARDVAFHPVTDRPEHVDFLRVSASTKVSVAIPVSFINEEQSPGMERGGVLNVVRHEIEVSCAADAIPDIIEVSLTGADINDSIHISTVTLPEGVEPTIDRDFTIATIVSPSSMRSEADAAEEEEVETEESEAEAAEESGEGEEGESSED